MLAGELGGPLNFFSSSQSRKLPYFFKWIDEYRFADVCCGIPSRNLAIIGALLMITSYVIDPFSQQLTKTYPCNIAYENTASIAVARIVSGYTNIDRPPMWAAAMSGLIYGVAENIQSQLFQCHQETAPFP